MSKRRALGQHYLVDDAVIELMVGCAEIAGHDQVLEIGTGKGAVTRELCKVATCVDGFEVDRENYLSTKSLGLGSLRLHQEDAFKAPRDFDILVSSLPYSESSTFVGWLAKLHYQRAVVLLQKDFGEKLLARPEDPHYRAVSVISQISSQLTIISEVGRTSFSPPPAVSSVLVVVTHRRVLSDDQIHLIKMLFSQRRRKLGTALKNLKLVLPRANPSELSRRVETLSADEIEAALTRLGTL